MSNAEQKDLEEPIEAQPDPELSIDDLDLLMEDLTKTVGDIDTWLQAIRALVLGQLMQYGSASAIGGDGGFQLAEHFKPKSLAEAVKVIIDITKIVEGDDHTTWPKYQELLQKLVRR